MSESLAGIRVLVVEDHSDSRDVLEQSLGFLGATVITAINGEEAVPCLAEIKGSSRPVPVILVSGFAASHIPAVAEAQFALKFLKPIDPFELGRQIALLLRQKMS